MRRGSKNTIPLRPNGLSWVLLCVYSALFVYLAFFSKDEIVLEKTLIYSFSLGAAVFMLAVIALCMGKIQLGKRGLSVRKLFRRARIPWDRIRFVGTVRAIPSPSKKPFLIISTLEAPWERLRPQAPLLVNLFIQGDDATLFTMPNGQLERTLRERCPLEMRKLKLISGRLMPDEWPKDA